jgi:hypothetical protein
MTAAELSFCAPILLLALACRACLAEPEVTLLRTPDRGIQPQAAVDDKGTVHLVYFKGAAEGGDIFYVHHNPGETEFTRPIRVNTQPRSAMALGTIRGAQLALGRNGRIHVVWDGMGKGAATSSADPKLVPLYYTRLNDAGTAFEPERNMINYAYGLDGGSSVAADLFGNVYVTWHAPVPGNTNGEAGRAVFLAPSADDGKTFGREKLAISKPTGACACCGMRAFADRRGDVFALFRAASTDGMQRDETLLLSRNQGANFQVAYLHQWNVSACPMSSASVSESTEGVLAAAETHGRVFFVRVNPASGAASEPVSPEPPAKHPVVVANVRGEILLAWTEGTAWGKGGSVAWQVYDRELQPTVVKGRADGLPAWSLATAFPNPDGSFTIVY